MMKLLVVLGLLGVTSLFADYQLTLIDKDGNQTNECVKSYSFSNNLESIARQKGLSNGIYSEEEVMTNNIYMGKPIYRKIVTIPSNLIGDKITHHVNYINPAKNIETLIFARKIGVDYSATSTINTGKDEWYKYYVYYPTYFQYALGNTSARAFSGAKVILEYTKTTDTANTSPNKFQSYLIYKLSSTTNEDVITKNMKNLGVQILEGYSYDATTNSCTKK